MLALQVFQGFFLLAFPPLLTPPRGGFGWILVVLLLGILLGIFPRRAEAAAILDRATQSYANRSGEVITGGTFSYNPSAYVADGYQTVESDGVRTVVSLPS